MKQQFKQKVKDFVDRTGMTITRLCNEINYTQNSKIRKYIYDDNYTKDLEYKTMEKISNFIDNYKNK